MASNKSVCNCPNPPGGEAVCEAHQIAICRVKKGRVRTECINPPQEVLAHAIKSGDASVLKEWVLDEVLGADRDLFKEKKWAAGGSAPEWNFSNSKTGEEVSLGIPAVVRHAIGMASLLHIDGLVSLPKAEKPFDY